MRIKNWRKFQHFKDRRPPWIKLHREMLEQRDINSISDCSFRVLIGLYLLASEDEAMEGNLPPIDDIAFRLRMDEAKIRAAVQELTPWVEHDDIESISERHQVGPPEAEAYKEEAEEEIEKKKSRKIGKRFTPPTLAEIIAYCQERNKGVDPERWMDHYTSNGWKVGKNSMKDWKAAVRTWEKNDGQGSAGGAGAVRGKAAASRTFEPTKNVADYGKQDPIPDW